MKLIIAIALTLLKTQALATGSVYCESKNGEFILEGTVARMSGDPLVGNTYLKINKDEFSIQKFQVVNYWSDSKELKMLILDDQVNETILKLEVKKNIFGNFTGKAKTADKVFKVNCPFY